MSRSLAALASARSFSVAAILALSSINSSDMLEEIRYSILKIFNFFQLIKSYLLIALVLFTVNFHATFSCKYFTSLIKYKCVAKRNGTSAMMAATRASRVQVLDKHICVFDTGASETFGYSRLMVTEHMSMEEPLIVDTANNENLVINHKGLCCRLGEIFINETLPVTLLSARLEEKFEIYYFQGVKYEVKVRINKLIFAFAHWRS